MGRRPWITRRITTTTAMTSRMWMKPPIVYELTIPRAHRMSKITKIVHSIENPPLLELAARNHSTEGCAFRARGWWEDGCRTSAGRSARAARRQRVLEDRDLRVRLGDLVREDHSQHL